MDLLDYVIDRLAGSTEPPTDEMKRQNLREIQEDALLDRVQAQNIPQVVLLMIRITSSSIAGFIENRSEEFINLMLLIFLMSDMKEQHAFAHDFINTIIQSRKSTLIIKCTCLISSRNKNYIPYFASQNVIKNYTYVDSPVKDEPRCILTEATTEIPELEIKHFLNCLVYSCTLHYENKFDEKLCMILDIFENPDVPELYKFLIGAVIPHINKFLENCKIISLPLLQTYARYFDLTRTQVDLIKDNYPQFWQQLCDTNIFYHNF